MHYLLIPYLLLCLLFADQFLQRQDPAKRGGMLIIASGLFLLLFLAMTFRPVAGDSWRYYRHFLTIRELSLDEALTYQRSDPLFVLLTWLAGKLGSEAWLLYGSILLVYFGLFIRAMRGLVGLPQTTILLIIYSTYPFFVAYAASGLRQGLALVFLLMGYVRWHQHRRLVALMWLMLAPLWHHGAMLALAFFIAHELMCRWIPSERLRWRLVMIAVFLSLGLSATGVNESLMKNLSGAVEINSSEEIYFTDNTTVNYRTGFRPDFVSFSMLPLISAYWLRRRSPVFSYEGSGWWLSLYLSLNTIYHLFAFAPFSDRFAAFSWFLLPLVIYLQIGETNQPGLMTRFVLVIIGINVLLLQFYTANWLGVPEGW